MRKLVISGMTVVLMVAICQSRMENPPNEVDKIAAQLRQSVQKGEIKKRDAVIEMETLARKYNALVNESLPDARSSDVHLCLSAFKTLQEFRDRHSLALFEEMTGSAHSGISTIAFGSYTWIAGVLDSLPFIEKVVADPNTPEINRQKAYLALGNAIEWTKSSLPKDIPKICAFMLGRKKPESDEMVRRLDGLLNEHLPDYIDSGHRKKVAERLAKSDREVVRNYWEAVKEEIKKAPELKRERENEIKRKQAHYIEIIKSDTNRSARVSAMLEFLYPLSANEYVWRTILFNNQAAFAEWTSDKNENVRMIAVFNLTDEELLAKVAKNDTSEWIRKEAAEQLNKLKKQNE